MGKKKTKCKPSVLGFTSPMGNISSDSEASEPEVPQVCALIERTVDSPGDMFVIDGGEMALRMGISGMAITAHTPMEMVQLVLYAVQSWILQSTMLALLWREVQRCTTQLPDPDTGVKWELITLILCVALSLHFVNCFGDIPFAFNILLRIHHFYDTRQEILLAGPIFFGDAVVVPLCQVFIGGLFICTSYSLVDVLLNSCAVAFISQIDNWILGLSKSMKGLAGPSGSCTVHIPYNMVVSKAMQYSICVTPVAPVIFSVSIVCWAHRLGLTAHIEGRA